MLRIPIYLLLQLITSICLGQVSDGLIAKYSFNNGNANDSEGTIDGIINNATLTTDRFGCANHAFLFRGSDTSFITLEDNFDSFLAQADSSFSFSLWLKRYDTTIFRRPVLLSKYGNSVCGEDQREFVLLIDSNRVQFLYFNTLYFGDARIITGSSIIRDTNWHHLVVNYDGSIDTNDGLDRVKFFLDNTPESTQLEASYGNLGDIQNGSAHFSIGPQLSSSGNFCGGIENIFDGKIDDIQLFNKRLSIAEVDLLFGDERPCPSTPIDKNLTKSNIHIYPNPASYGINIESKIPIESVHIVGLNGVIIESYFNTDINQIDIRKYSNGIYFVKCHLSNGNRFIRKLFVQK